MVVLFCNIKCGATLQINGDLNASQLKPVSRCTSIRSEIGY